MANRKVRMNVKISGSRDGVDWPDKGEVISVPEDEAKTLIANGYASDPKSKDDDEEHATANESKVETAVPAGNKPVRSGLTKADLEK
jgi:hypothetical protein